MIHSKIILWADLVILLICFLGLYQISEKADLPLQFEDYNSRLIADQAYYSASDKKELVRPGDFILSVQNIPVLYRDEVETIIDGMNIGRTASVTILRNSNRINVDVGLTKFYSDFYIFSVLISGLIFFIVAAFVILKSPQMKVAQVFHWVTIGTGVIIMTTWGNYSLLHWAAGFLTRTAFHLAYVFVPVSFVHFTFEFPKKNYFRQRKFLSLLYGISILLFLAASVSFSLFLNSGAGYYLRLYAQLFNIIRIYLVLCIIAAVIIFIISYRSALTIPEKKKLKWILFSLIIGPGSFILLWVIPQSLINYGLIPEEFVILLMVIVPIGFAIAIVRHHLFDIDHIINRSLVYSVLISGIVLTYMLIVYITAFFVPDISRPVVFILVTAFVAFLFEPVKKYVQEFVDKRFFKIRYNFRIASKELLEKVRNAGDINTLSRMIIEEINEIIPANKIGFFISNNTNRFYLAAGNNIDENILNLIDCDELIIDLKEAGGNSEEIEAGASIRAERSFPLKDYGINLVFPAVSAEKKTLALLAVGSRKSGYLFTIEDIDLYNAVINEAGINIERIRLNESLIRKQLEQEQLIEMNKLKSFFLSTVTHDLKTPITSIKIFAELLEDAGSLSGGQKEEYPAIIMGECGRLTRLIDNILDLTKIEKGIKEYHFSAADMEELVRYSLNIMSYQIKLEKCTLDVSFPLEDECLIYADSDSIISAIVNLISNALKYSIAPKEISICVYKDKDNAVFKIFNNCPEINTEELEHLSEPYFRTKSSKDGFIQGTGLGLYLVRQIIQSHNGTLTINNESGKGCSFIITIPLWRANAKDINY